MHETCRKAMTEKLTELACTLVEIAGLLNSTAAEIHKAETAPASTEPPAEKTTEPKPEYPASETKEAPEKEYSFEEVRGILADKARSGYRAEVKALLTKHGAEQLSDIRDPKELAQLVREAEGIGNG